MCPAIVDIQLTLVELKKKEGWMNGCMIEFIDGQIDGLLVFPGQYVVYS